MVGRDARPTFCLQTISQNPRTMTPHLNSLSDPHDALLSLAGEFFGPALVEGASAVDAAQVPEPFNKLLVHHEHMTTKLQEYHGVPVELEVVEARVRNDVYQRKILLTAAGTNHVVEVGVARIDLRYTSDDVRRAIEARQAPLGDILIAHDVLRRIEPKWYFRFEGGGPLIAAFDRPLDLPIYGRVGVIYCDHEPAIELLEVVAADKVGGRMTNDQ